MSGAASNDFSTPAQVADAKIQKICDAVNRKCLCFLRSHYYVLLSSKRRNSWCSCRWNLTQRSWSSLAMSTLESLQPVYTEKSLRLSLRSTWSRWFGLFLKCLMWLVHALKNVSLFPLQVFVGGERYAHIRVNEAVTSGELRLVDATYPKAEDDPLVPF